MHGGVGSGKTFLMDLFYDNMNYKSVNNVTKSRKHFSTFMLDIHNRMSIKQKERKNDINKGWLKRVLPKIHDDIGGIADSSQQKTINFFGIKMVLSAGSGSYNAFDSENKDPLPAIAAEIVKESRVLCLDEFEVTDVADAYILAR